jgi:hypothetical protein
MEGAFSEERPNLDRTEGEMIVPSAPVSRMSVTGPRPLILAWTKTGEPGEKGILVGPLLSGLGFNSGGGGVGRRESASARERYSSRTLSRVPV